MNTIEQSNAQGGITITSQNLSRFNKRLHKAMQEAGLDVSYSTATQLFAKSCGKKNLHELTDILNEVEKSSLNAMPMKQKHQPLVQTESENENPTLQKVEGEDYSDFYDFYGDRKKVFISIVFKFMKLGSFIKETLSWESSQSHVFFLKKPNSPAGTFDFVIHQMFNNNLHTFVIEFVNFKIVPGDNASLSKRKLDVAKEFSSFFNLDFERNTIIEDQLMTLMRVIPGYRYDFIKSPIFESIKPIYTAGLYKQSFVLVSFDDFLKIKKNIVSNFYYKDKNGMRKSDLVKIINDEALVDGVIESYSYSLAEGLQALENFDGNAYLFEVLDYCGFDNVSKLSRFLISKDRNGDGEFYLRASTYVDSASTTGKKYNKEIKTITDIHFFEGILQKDFEFPRISVNDSSFNNFMEGYNY